jgi:hypothetical protein
MYLALANWVAGTVPAGRAQALALTALEESMHWANTALAYERGGR